MGKITAALLRQCSSQRHISEVQSEVRSSYKFSNVTHLYLQEKGIEFIESLDLCKNLLALYLFDNEIVRIQNLDNLNRLFYLYLNNNKILKMENLDSLVNLRILKLGGNQIRRVEGLENLFNLEQLWVENQTLHEGESLSFCPISMSALSDSLKLLSASEDGLKSLSAFRPLKRLEKLYVDDNSLTSLQDVVDCLCMLQNLKELRIKNNAVCKVFSFRDNVIAYCPKLNRVDNFVVPENYRRSVSMWKDKLLGMDGKSPPSSETQKSGSNQLKKRFVQARIGIEPPLNLTMPTTISSAPQLSQRGDGQDVAAPIEYTDPDIRQVKSMEDSST